MKKLAHHKTAKKTTASHRAHGHHPAKAKSHHIKRAATHHPAKLHKVKAPKVIHAKKVKALKPKKPANMMQKDRTAGRAMTRELKVARGTSGKVKF